MVLPVRIPPLAPACLPRSEELQPGRQRQTAGHFLHLLLQGSFDLTLGILEARDDQVLENLGLVRLQQTGIDLETGHLALAVERDPDEPAPGLPLDPQLGKLLLHLLDAGLYFLRLLHHSHQIFHLVLRFWDTGLTRGSDGHPALLSSCRSSASGRTALTSAPGKTSNNTWTAG